MAALMSPNLQKFLPSGEAREGTRRRQDSKGIANCLGSTSHVAESAASLAAEVRGLLHKAGACCLLLWNSVVWGAVLHGAVWCRATGRCQMMVPGEA